MFKEILVKGIQFLVLIFALGFLNPSVSGEMKKSHTQEVALKGKILTNIDSSELKGTYIFKSGSRVYLISPKLHNFIQDDIGRDVILYGTLIGGERIIKIEYIRAK